VSHLTNNEISKSSLIGAQLGKYEIQAEIGRGGMGAVYRGYDPDLERSVAVKVLAPHLVWEKEFVQRFLREARAAARLNHPHIVTIYDVGQQGERYYFVMEHLEGQTLTELIHQRGPLAPDEALALLRPLAAALDEAHRAGLVHRDVKPANVIVSPTGQVKLTDFGIARAAQETRLTDTGAIVGTPDYMSPEQAKGLAIDARSDQYSLAVAAFEMLSGEAPFQADSTLALLHKIVYEPPPPISRLQPHLPAGVEAALEKALAKEPGERYDTAGEFVETLARALAGEKIAPAIPPARRRRAVLAGGLTGLALLALLAALALRGGGEAVVTATPTPSIAIARATDTPSPTPAPTATPTTTRSPTPTRTATPSPSAAPSPTPGPQERTAMAQAACIYGVELVQISDRFNFWYVSSSPSFGLVLRNTGGCPWPADTRLVLLSENIPDWPESWPVGALEVDESQEIEIELAAPATAQVLTIAWQLQGPGGLLIGSQITRTLRIELSPTATPTPTPRPTPTPLPPPPPTQPPPLSPLQLPAFSTQGLAPQSFPTRQLLLGSTHGPVKAGAWALALALGMAGLAPAARSKRRKGQPEFHRRRS